MRIVDELKQYIFKDFDFLEKLSQMGLSQQDFLDILGKKIKEQLLNYEYSTNIPKKYEASSPEKIEKLLGIQLQGLREHICWPTWKDNPCVSKKCFGPYSGRVEVDAIINRDEDCCIIEYENDHKTLCNDFMKMFWLHDVIDKPFESLLVTRLTSLQRVENETIVERFNNWVDINHTIFDILLQDWSILEIIDLPYRRLRRFYWKP